MKKTTLLNLLIVVLLSTVMSSCEKVLSLDKLKKLGYKEQETQLCVDAFLNNDTCFKVIKLRKTSSYFSNQADLPPATGATVTITDLANRKFHFFDANNNGDYIWTPSATDSFPTIPFGVQGNVYRLEISYGGEEYESVSYMDTVPPIDSLWATEGGAFGGPVSEADKGTYVLQMNAKDRVGDGDGYWFKTIINGVFTSKASELNLAYDAAFGPGSDGVQFIAPIVFSLSPRRFKHGEHVTVELNSVGVPTVYFLVAMQTQISNGGLFATPSSNVPTNIFNKNKDSKIKALGWFCTPSVSRKSVVIP